VGALVLAIGAWSLVSHKPTYAASNTVVFVASPTLGELELTTGRPVAPSAQSDLARFKDMTVVGDIFARVYRSRTKYDQLVSEGLEGRLDVTTKREVLSDAPDHGPVIVFTVQSRSPSAAVSGAALVANDLKNELSRRQAGADPALTVTAAVVSLADQAQLVKGSRVRSAVAFFVLALLVGWLTGRAFRARGEGAPDPVAD
jgi:hypothetical protein